MFFSGFHVNLVLRSATSASLDDQTASPSIEQTGESIDSNFNIFNALSCTDTSETKESIDDSMLAASDNGRAQFVSINIDTFAIRLARSSAISV